MTTSTALYSLNVITPGFYRIHYHVGVAFGSGPYRLSPFVPAVTMKTIKTINTGNIAINPKIGTNCESKMGANPNSIHQPLRSMS